MTFKADNLCLDASKRSIASRILSFISVHCWLSRDGYIIVNLLNVKTFRVFNFFFIGLLAHLESLSGYLVYPISTERIFAVWNTMSLAFESPTSLSIPLSDSIQNLPSSSYTY